jgi:hypothetical protein
VFQVLSGLADRLERALTEVRNGMAQVRSARPPEELPADTELETS